MIIPHTEEFSLSQYPQSFLKNQEVQKCLFITL